MLTEGHSEFPERKSLARDPIQCLLGDMGHNKGKDNVKKRLSRRKKAERLHEAKATAKAAS